MRKKNHKKKEWKMRYYARIMNIVTRIFCLFIITYYLPKKILRLKDDGKIK